MALTAIRPKPVRGRPLRRSDPQEEPVKPLSQSYSPRRRRKANVYDAVAGRVGIHRFTRITNNPFARSGYLRRPSHDQGQQGGGGAGEMGAEGKEELEDGEGGDDDGDNDNNNDNGEEDEQDTPLNPEDVLFRRKNAPERFAEDDFYRADRWLDPDANPDERLPESDILKAVHAFAADYYARGLPPDSGLRFSSRQHRFIRVAGGDFYDFDDEEETDVTDEDGKDEDGMDEEEGEDREGNEEGDENSDGSHDESNSDSASNSASDIAVESASDEDDHNGEKDGGGREERARSRKTLGPRKAQRCRSSKSLSLMERRRSSGGGNGGDGEDERISHNLHSMDGTALLAIGILLEERIKTLLGERGDMVLVEGEDEEGGWGGAQRVPESGFFDDHKAREAASLASRLRRQRRARARIATSEDEDEDESDRESESEDADDEEGDTPPAKRRRTGSRHLIRSSSEG